MPRILPMLIRGRTDICFCAAKAKPQSIAAAKKSRDDRYLFINYVRFQVDGVKSISMGKSSSLPASMQKDRTSFENHENP